MVSFFSIISSSHLCSADKKVNPLLPFFAIHSTTAAFYCKYDQVHHFPCHSYHIPRSPPQVHHSYLTIITFFHIAEYQGRTGFESFWGNYNCLLAHRTFGVKKKKSLNLEPWALKGITDAPTCCTRMSPILLMTKLRSLPASHDSCRLSFILQKNCLCISSSSSKQGNILSTMLWSSCSSSFIPFLNISDIMNRVWMWCTSVCISSAVRKERAYCSNLLNILHTF